MVFIILPALAAEPCDVQAVVAAAQAADARVVASDVLGFEREVAKLQAQIACLAEPVTPEVAADVHLTLGLWHWAHSQDELATASMLAARRAAPSRLLADDLFPQGDTLRVAFDAPSGTPAFAAVKAPPARLIWFDGVVTRQRPSDVPTLVQVAGLDGRPSVSRVLLPTDRVPSPPWVHRQRRDLAIVSATSAGAAAALYAGAWVVHEQFVRLPAEDIPGLERDQANANRLSIGALVSALVSVGTGVTVAVLR
jgi:hypothetical protein